MSFTTEMYASIMDDMRTKPIQDDKSTAMRLVTYTNSLRVGFSVDKRNYLKALYLSVGHDIVNASFPKWKGVSIELAQLLDYNTDEIFVLMKELPDSSSDIFEMVAEDLRRAIEEVKDPSTAFATVVDVLIKWRSFFQYDGEMVLSDIEQQGLMGELLFLQESIQEIGIHAVAKWAGCNAETHDFYFDDHAVEVKTTSAKEPYRVHISSEYQLDVSDVVGNLYLKFYAFRKSNSTGVTLAQIVASIRQMLDGATLLLGQFNEKLHKYGYFDEMSELYVDGYYIRDTYQFRISADFPSITPAMLGIGVSKVEYVLGLDHCGTFEISNEELMSLLKGGNKNA